MSTLAGRIEWQSPWLHGAIGFFTWVLAQPLAGVLFWDGAAGTIDIATIVVGLIAGIVAAGYHLILTRHEYPS
ncbi:hypothetical protein [Halococcus hamelinensis]|uniref:Uncharacterized protein n=1 Tax=Halococcus hamelinensis 100A6 TaxID=1132509 RepID=M0LW13_9EURY|nr:hypothetical protein [Halococcus hamelinensis]EMA37777.1 hypothetical protein C447_12415 [Halococcus hamelinensis 100A6]